MLNENYITQPEASDIGHRLARLVKSEKGGYINVIYM